MKVHAVPAFNDNYIWLIESENTKRVMIVDPGDATPVIRALSEHQFEPAAILITHHHYDHVGGIEQLTQQYPIPVFGPEGELIQGISQPVSAGKNISLPSDFAPFTILDTPGHTSGHISYLIDDALFCGDTLFAGGCGRLLGGTAEQLFQSLNLIASLPDTTRIFCAHEYTESNLRFALAVEPDNTALQNRIKQVAQQRQQGLATVPSILTTEQTTNPFLRCDQPSVSASVQHHCGKALHSPLEVFTELRRWKDLF